jgi:outer membrane protein
VLNKSKRNVQEQRCACIIQLINRLNLPDIVGTKQKLQMKKVFTILLISAGLLAGSLVKAQTQPKIGFISTQELITAMPEYKKADTALADYQSALNQQYAEKVQDFNRRDSLLSGPDTAKYTRAQLEVMRNELGKVYVELQGWNQKAQQMYQSKEEQQMKPILDKARKAIQDVAKESGYAYVFTKEQLLVSPPGDDLLPLGKKKLGLK